MAARFLGLATVPVRVLPTIERREDVLSLQLIENLQREDLNPIDMAEGLHAFIHARQRDVSLGEIMNAFILYERSPERFSGDFAGTIPTIV